MGRFNEMLAASYSRGARAILGLQEQEGITTVAPEVMPIFPVASDDLDHALLRDKRWFSGRDTDAALAANFSHVLCRNPAGSGVIVVVDAITVHHAAGASYVFVVQSGATILTLDASAAAMYHDLRQPLASTTPVLIGNRTQAAAGGTNDGYLVTRAAGDSVMWPTRFVLPPRSEVIVRPVVVNVAVAANFHGYIRPARPDELTV